MPKTKIAAKAMPMDKDNKKNISAKMSKSKTIKTTAPAEGGMKKDDEKRKIRFKAGTVVLIISKHKAKFLIFNFY